MKLVEILALELNKWPYGQTWASQDPDKEVRFDSEPIHDFYVSQLADDAGLEIGCGARVTREMWEAERAKLNRAVEWDGDGLPPVGSICEGKECGEWVKVEIIAHYEGRAVCMLPSKERVAIADPGSLRPIRTPEQIAAEKREREINELVETIVCHYEYPKGAESYIGLARALHNAGYRKQEKD